MKFSVPHTNEEPLYPGFAPNTSFYTDMLDSTHQDYKFPASSNPKIQPTNSRISGNYHSTLTLPTHNSDPYLAFMSPPYLGQDYEVIPRGQSSMSSPSSVLWGPCGPSTNLQGGQSVDTPFSASWGPPETLTNIQDRQPFHPASSYGGSSYVPYQHGQYGLNGYTGISHNESSSAYLQPQPTPFHPETIYVPSEPFVTSEKPHVCLSCGKSFARKGDMERHATTHGPPHLWCNVNGCGKGFHRLDKLQEHQKRRNLKRHRVL